LGSSLDAKNIPSVKKCHSLLLGERYRRKMFDENGQLLYLANCNMLSSSNLQPGSMVLHHELDIFYDTLAVCGCSKCKGLKKNHQHVTLSHYIDDRLPKIDGLIHLSVVNNPIGDIEKTRRNTSMCSFFENLEAKSTTFPPKLTNLSPSIESTRSYYSDPKYDINTIQNITTRRSKTLYELREKMSKYTPKFIQLLEGSNDFPLPIHLQSKYQTSYN
jgi:hypothetical protein